MPLGDNNIIIGIVITTIVFIILGFFILVLVAYVNQRKKRHIDEKKTMHLDFQRELLHTQLEIQEQTLKTISIEIHDNIGQILTLAKLNLQIIQPIETDKLLQRVGDSKALISKAIQDLRDLSKSTNADYIIETGLLHCIRSELDVLNRTGQYETSLQVSGVPKKIDNQKTLILFRIVQEILNNAVKHASASIINVAIKYDDGQFCLSVFDNGCGFDTEAIGSYKKSGIGIQNIKNRTKLIGAQVTISSSPDVGTRYEFSLLV